MAIPERKQKAEEIASQIKLNVSESTKLGAGSKSSMWFYPGEVLEDGEMRVTLMGTGWGNVVGPSQKGPSIFVELGNENKDSFVFDVGPGCILNYNAMGIPMSRMNHIFISHLHMDHCSDLPFIYAFGPNLGDRFKELHIYGPSGPTVYGENKKTGTTLGIKNMVEGMKQFTQWHTTSFETMTYGAKQSYNLDNNVHEFDYRECGGTVYGSDKRKGKEDHVVIKHFPALHIIDGAVSYRLEWTPKGQDEPIVLVYSGDTLPNDFMLEYGAGADLLVHETAPSIELVMNGANATPAEAFAIVCNSHTPANSLGSIIQKTKPGLAITTHSPMDPRSIETLIMGVHEGFNTANAKSDETIKEKLAYKLNYQVGADLMVFNVSKPAKDELSITKRMAASVDRPWPVREKVNTSENIMSDEGVKHYQNGISTEAPFKLKGRIFEKLNEAPQCAIYNKSQENESDDENTF
ncbi:MBL fold metallo-hydrolase [Kordia sp.]|uniref:MBL fold metallo-hydrolase n=1 Tax=Kordia sp. TaxID=1965332 RepID=UPI003D6BEF8D